MNAPHRFVAETYRGWTVHFDPKPIPCRDFDWEATHPDYDAWTEDGSWTNNGLKAGGATYELLCQDIDAREEELADIADDEGEAEDSRMSLPGADWRESTYAEQAGLGL